MVEVVQEGGLPCIKALTIPSLPTEVLMTHGVARVMLTQEQKQGHQV